MRESSVNRLMVQKSGETVEGTVDGTVVGSLSKYLHGFIHPR